VDLSVSFAGLTLKNPVLTASGTFGYGLEFMDYGDLRDLGGIVVKGTSLEPREGNPMPRVAETACGMLNAIGLQNPGVEVFIKDYLPRLPWRETAVIVNIYACDAAEFGELAGILAAERGVAALEVNISCPNVKAGGVQFGQDPAMAAQVTEAVKARAGTKPVIVKLSPNVTDIAAVAKACEAAGADALSLINTLSAMAVDLKTRTPRLANVIGGLSGPAIKPVALRCLHQVRRAVSIPLIGMGGIVTPEDALEFILVGAHAVQVGTGNFLRPDLSFRLAKELPEACARCGVGSWDDFRESLKA
jgi:dihydroorotate dehydrogenase (NAD+) catalytic subunit